MRMTRAALRAQEAEGDLHTQIDGKLREYGAASQFSDNSTGPLIHEDAIEEDRESNESHNTEDGNDDGRPALRDITTENYPSAGLNGLVTDEMAEEELKTAKKAKSKKGKKSAKMNDNVAGLQSAEIVKNLCDESSLDNSQATSEETSTEEELHHSADVGVECERLQENSIQNLQADLQLEQTSETIHSDQARPQTEVSTACVTDVSESHEHSAPETPVQTTETFSKTPKFNPEIHLPAEQSPNMHPDMTEDSFVDSIKTRSPSKFSQSMSDLQGEDSDAFIRSTIVRSPPKAALQVPSPNSQRIEDSVEAIDALEDAIEKFAENMPVLQVLPFESPAKLRKTPARTPAKVATRTPAKVLTQTPGKSSTRMSTKTPAKTTSTAKTPLKLVTPKVRVPSVRKSEPRTPQTLKEKLASAKRETVKERVNAIESKPTPAPHRRATSVHILKRDVPEVKQTLRSKHTATKSVSAIVPNTMTSMSFSNSPAKQGANQLKKRVTSGGILSTSKPAFVPAKSNKPVTTATFSLPGEAIAAKLKAQREERSKKEEVEVEKKTTFKARPAPTRTARPSFVPRENKASTARLSVRQASGENKENMAPARSSSTVALSKSTASSTFKSSTTTATANSSVRRTTIAPKPTSTLESRKQNPTPSTVSTHASQRISSLSSGQQITLTKAETAQQKLKGKEVYDRIKSSIQQQDEERKGKEEAARKARAEAAERGRQASREWAEKQKKRLAGSGKATAVAPVN